MFFFHVPCGISVIYRSTVTSPDICNMQYAMYYYYALFIFCLRIVQAHRNAYPVSIISVSVLTLTFNWKYPIVVNISIIY